MRFCPFCSAENSDGATHCASCSRKLPPVPPRRKHTTQSPEPAIAVAGETRPRTSTSSGRLPLPNRADRARPTTRPPRLVARDSQPVEPRLDEPGDTAEPDGATPAPITEPETTEPAPAPVTIDDDDLEPVPEPVVARVTRRDTRPTTAPPPIPPPITRPVSKPVQAKRELEPELLKPKSVKTPEIIDDDWGDPDLLEVPEPAPRRREITSDWDPVAPEPATDGSDRTPLGKGRPVDPDIDGSGLRPLDEYTTPPTQIGPEDSPVVDPVPEVPESGLVPAVKYLVRFVKARWQRRSAIRTLKEQIKTDTASLDAMLGVLGREVRVRGVNNRVLEAENKAIDQAEDRKATADREFSELQNKQAEENSRFAEIESDRDEKVADAESALDEAKSELGSLEAQRRGLRDKRKNVDRQIAGLIKNAEARESEAAKLEMGEARQELRRAAEGLRRDAASLDPERQDLDRRLAALDRPLSKATAKVEALKAELESARRSLNDAREGHRHRLSEIEAERGRKSRELAQADAEIQRRLVTLGTLVNLNRIKGSDFVELYARIDVLRSAIGSRTTEIDRLSAEREAYDKRALTRGALALGGAFVILCLLLAIVLW